jgi:nucleotide-binding universal stress UspA family protein
MSTQHFLVPVDFSEYANQALDYAIALATKLQSRLTLLHVIYMPALAAGEIGPYMTDIEAQARKAIEGNLQRVNDAGLEGTTMLVHGIPWQEIVQTAEDKLADLIIMGTHGRSGIQHVLLGSVAEKVVRLAPCPVLVTRASPKEASTS